jgi:hypothetical protein
MGVLAVLPCTMYQYNNTATQLVGFTSGLNLTKPAKTGTFLVHAWYMAGTLVLRNIALFCPKILEVFCLVHGTCKNFQPFKWNVFGKI